MSLWRQLTRGLRVLANRRAADQDIADEVSHAEIMLLRTLRRTNRISLRGFINFLEC
jgi:hypothetical protein